MAMFVITRGSYITHFCIISPPFQTVQGDAGELQILRAPAILSSPGGDQLPPRCIGLEPITSSRDGSTQQKGAQKLCERM